MDFDNSWHKDGQNDRIMKGGLIFHLFWFMSAHYHVKHRCTKLLHFTVIICIRLLTFAISIWQMAPQGATWLINFVVLNIVFTMKIADNKIADLW